MREPFDRNLQWAAAMALFAFYATVAYATILGLMWIIEILFG